MEAHCIAIELKYQNQALKSGQHGQILNETSNKAKIKKEIDVLETMNIKLEHSVAKLRKENETLKKHYKDLYDSIKITRSKTIEQTTSLLANNADLKAQIQKKFNKTSVLGKPVLPSLRNQSVVRQPSAFKSERPQMSKQRFASQVDVNNNSSRPVTQHYLPKRRESVSAKPDHMIASSESRNSSKNMPRFSLNDMVHNHYLDEARKKTHERDRNTKTSMMPSARFQSTAYGSKPKPRSTSHSTKSLPCVFNANHDACITKLLKEVNSRAKIQSHKTKNSSKLIDQKSHTQKHGRQIFTRHRFSPNKTFAVYEKTSPRSDLRWKPTVEFSNLSVLGGFLQESYSTLAQERLTVNPYMVPYVMSTTKSQSMVAEKADISKTKCHSGFTNDEIEMTCDSHDVNDRVEKSIRLFVRRIFQMENIKLFHSLSDVTTPSNASDKRHNNLYNFIYFNSTTSVTA
ncbi:hypothetical protein Tco_0508098 [Tanacetum coccineum]